MARLFVALRPPPAMRERLRATMHGLTGARWQSDEQLHVTLRFIGEADRHQVEDIAAALARVHAPLLDLGIDGVGSFTSKGIPNSVWAAVTRSAELSRLAKSVDRALVAIGFAPETRAFHPHITLARLGRRAMPIDPWTATHAALRIDPATFEHVILYESILGQSGSSYVVVERYALS